ncbi:endonuclease [Streptomyces sp. NPDC021224]|uniref:endonuclease n=1 Tax=unclassified Streptomyces TaxID=2593676 RepID=UPI00379B1A2B
MAGTDRQDITHALLDGYGRTYAEQAGIRMRDTPQPLYRLLVLADLLSARIRADIAVAAAKELSAAGMRDPRGMADATWQQRVDALGRGGYRRYDESTATRLGEGADLAQERYGGDLRRLRDAADGDVAEIRGRLRDFPGIGPAGADIFLREVQTVWPQVAPYFGAKAEQGAGALGLPRSPGRLAGLAEDAETDPAVLAAALVRVSLDRKGPETVREAAR